VSSVAENDHQMLEKMAGFLREWAQHYETGVQTIALCEKNGQWRNLVAKISFVRKGTQPPETNSHKYPQVVLARRLITPDETIALVRVLVEEAKLDTGTQLGSVPLECHFGWPGDSRRQSGWREWEEWPSEIFRLEPAENFQVRDAHALGPLVAIDGPYYPSAELLLRDFFGIRSKLNGWPQHLQGGVVVALPDFRARISGLAVAVGYLKIGLEHAFIDPSDLVLQVYAEDITGPLVQKCIQQPEAVAQVDLAGKCSRASVALLCRSRGEVLDERSFREGGWTDEGVTFETSALVVEQMLLVGEGETLEFKERLERGTGEKLAKTAVAFANTNGGTIVFGVNDDLRVVGCENARALADSVTNVLRSFCDLMPVFSTEVVDYEDKELLLVHVKRTDGPIYTVRERGPFIRANGSNRLPSSQELERLRGGQPVSQFLGFSGVTI
jgi:Schlafen, AlbA_2